MSESAVSHSLMTLFKEEKDAYNALTCRQPEDGDILLTKTWGFRDNDGDFDALGRALVRPTQALLSHSKHGSMNSEHIAIAHLPPNKGIMRVDAHYGRGGITLNDIDTRDFLVVYRCKDASVAASALVVALSLAGEGNNNPIEQGGYAIASTVVSLVRLKFQGPSARKYLKKIQDMVLADKAAKAPDMMCSEFVVACYEVANMIVHDTPLFKVDPRAVSPKQLEDLLEKRRDLFDKYRFPMKKAT
jgi:hypothetical protein